MCTCGDGGEHEGDGAHGGRRGCPICPSFMPRLSYLVPDDDAPAEEEETPPGEEVSSSSSISMSPFLPRKSSKYLALISATVVTPRGSIVALGDKEPRPETDPGWEERKAKRNAKRLRSPSESD